MKDATKYLDGLHGLLANNKEAIKPLWYKKTDSLMTFSHHHCL